MNKIISTFDDNGDLINSVTISGTKLKEGWIVMYKEPLQKLILECKEYSKVRVFTYLSTLQTYDAHIFTTIRQVAKSLNMTYKTTWDAFDWLQKNEYIKKTNVDGITAWVLNPKITTCGKKSIAKKNKEFGFDLGLPKRHSTTLSQVDIETGEIIDDDDVVVADGNDDDVISFDFEKKEAGYYEQN